MSKYQLLPPLTSEEYERLKTNIEEEGVQVPVVYDEDRNILDGHHRVKACEELGIKQWPRTVKFRLSEAQKKLLVLTLNETRRHLTQEDQKAIRKQRIALEAELRQQGMSTRQIAKEVGVSQTQVVQDLKKAGEQSCSPDTITGADGKTYPARKVSPITLFNPDAKTVERAKTLIETDEGTNLHGFVDSRQVNCAYRDAQERAMRQKIVDNPVPPPAGKYRTLVIDPPWKIQKILREERPTQAEMDYPTMTDDEIAELPIPDLLHEEGSHAYLWVTHKKLPLGLSLFKKWGVRYQCQMTWVKPTGMTPFSWMYNTEHVLFGRFGKLNLGQLGLKLSFEAPVTKHSEKPDVFYERVMLASPGPRLDMFARKTRDGFTVWGNELPAPGRYEDD